MNKEGETWKKKWKKNKKPINIIKTEVVQHKDENQFMMYILFEDQVHCFCVGIYSFILRTQELFLHENNSHGSPDKYTPFTGSCCNTSATDYLQHIIKLEAFTYSNIYNICLCSTRAALGVVGDWCKVLIAVSWPLMVWSTLTFGTYQLRFVSWVYHVIFSFIHFISFDTLNGMCAFRKPFSI